MEVHTSKHRLSIGPCRPLREWELFLSVASTKVFSLTLYGDDISGVLISNLVCREQKRLKYSNYIYLL